MSVAPFDHIFVVGAGAWGTALAGLCATGDVTTTLWAREEEVARDIRAGCGNTRFLPGVALPQSLNATHLLQDGQTADAVLFVVPAQFARGVLADLRNVFNGPTPVALCSKGVEQGSALLMTEVMADVWPEAVPAVLSGPSFARDVALGKPTAVTLASADAALGERWIASLGSQNFRPYLSDDLIGAELGGAVKNVLAIAAGAVVGRDLGESARAAIIARGFAEFQRLGVGLGANPSTMAGLSGLGDLILTAGSEQSRNMSLGVALGRGEALEEILAARNSVSEGAASASAVMALAQRVGVEMPICAAVESLLSGSAPLDDIIERLLSRPFRSETK